MRRRLPDRRRSISLDLEYDGTQYNIGLGYDAAGRIHEIFARGPKTGSTMEGLLDDICITLSLGLQHGVDPVALPKSMGRLGREGQRASVVGAMVDIIAAEAAIEADRR